MKAIYTRINKIKVFSDDCQLWWVLRPMENKVYLFCGYTLEELVEKIKEIKGASNVKKKYF